MRRRDRRAAVCDPGGRHFQDSSHPLSGSPPTPAAHTQEMRKRAVSGAATNKTPRGATRHGEAARSHLAEAVGEHRLPSKLLLANLLRDVHDPIASDRLKKSLNHCRGTVSRDKRSQPRRHHIWRWERDAGLKAQAADTSALARPWIAIVSRALASVEPDTVHVPERPHVIYPLSRKPYGQTGRMSSERPTQSRQRLSALPHRARPPRLARSLEYYFNCPGPWMPTSKKIGVPIFILRWCSS